MVYYIGVMRSFDTQLQWKYVNNMYLSYSKWSHDVDLSHDCAAVQSEAGEWFMQPVPCDADYDSMCQISTGTSTFVGFQKSCLSGNIPV